MLHNIEGSIICNQSKSFVQVQPTLKIKLCKNSIQRAQYKLTNYPPETTLFVNAPMYYIFAI